MAGALPSNASWALPEHHTYVSIDRAFKASLARLTFGVSPVALAQSYYKACIFDQRPRQGSGTATKHKRNALSPATLGSSPVNARAL